MMLSIYEQIGKGDSLRNIIQGPLQAYAMISENQIWPEQEL